jgi:predicted nucleic acid-binding protein
VKLVLDTSVLIGGPLPAAEEDAEVMVASVSFAELGFGVAVTADPSERLVRQSRLERLREAFGPGLPFDDRAAAMFERLCELVVAAGRSPRSRLLDLMIAATAYVNDAGVVTRDVADFDDLRSIMPIVEVP